ncbi:PilZ domain-containing protein [Anaerotignum sp. MB30-C6]|uniref:PilZ domain-containing protein n=1 Tax=Anaerotignum sp. MB30-C6 TaxID=3070814 RepID=UPI0027DB3816|nr:PilZ domain-containing protein [Anaerotignum sp. MB30-C6]WMI80998.1 PilZ domain-containing protein [Anaerotignum sp. MB30-C6]
MSIKCILLDEKSSVIDYADLSFMGNGVSFLIPFEEDTLGQFEEGDKVIFQVEDKYNQIYDADISEISYGKIHLNEVRNLAPLLHKDVRVEVEIQSTIFYTEDGRDIPVEVSLRDLSCGGMCFLCEEELNMDYEYLFMTSWIDTPIVVKFKILRKEVANYNMFAYGCEFLELLRTEESLLRASVFKIQAMNYRRKRMDEDDAV